MKYILSPHEWYAVNHFLKELKQSHSPVVSVYSPFSEISNMINTLRETERIPEIRKVEAVIEKRLASKHGYGTLCIFGWNTKEGVVIKELTIPKVLPPVYIVDKKAYIEPLYDILEINYEVLLLILDHKEAVFRHYNGKDILEHAKIKIYLRGRHRKGGWSQKRFERLRKIQITHFFKKVKRRLKDFDLRQFDLILLAGPGLAKKEFFQFFTNKKSRKKVRIIEGINFASHDDEIAMKMIDTLSRIRKEFEFQQFLKVGNRINKGLAKKENKIIYEALRRGAVETLLIASDYHVVTPLEKNRIIKMIELAEKTSTEVEFITNKEVLEKLHKHGSVIARPSR